MREGCICCIGEAGWDGQTRQFELEVIVDALGDRLGPESEQTVKWERSLPNWQSALSSYQCVVGWA